MQVTTTPSRHSSRRTVGTMSRAGAFSLANTRDETPSRSSSARRRQRRKRRLRLTCRSVTASDDHVITYGVVRAERNGKRLESRNIYLYRFD